MRDESVKDGNRISDTESFQSSADEQGFDDEDKDLLKEVLNYMKDCPGNIPPNKYKERERAKRATAKMNKIISVMSTQNINKKTKKEENDNRGGE